MILPYVHPYTCPRTADYSPFDKRPELTKIGKFETNERLNFDNCEVDNEDNVKDGSNHMEDGCES